MIKIFSRSQYKIDRKRIITTINNYLKEKGFNENKVINIIFLGKRKMKKIIQEYKKKNEVLPLLSFSYKENGDFDYFPSEEKTIGEIFICYPQAVLLAAEKEKEVDKLIIELIKHGIENIIKI